MSIKSPIGAIYGQLISTYGELNFGGRCAEGERDESQLPSRWYSYLASPFLGPHVGALTEKEGCIQTSKLVDIYIDKICLICWYCI